MGATFFTQLTMLNMLIAIMGDTFDYATENKEINATKTKLKLLDDYAVNLRLVPTEQDKKLRFLIVVTPEVDDEEDSEAWNGTVSQITGLINKNSNSIHEKTTNQLDGIKNDNTSLRE